jgi:hypothetical protein
MAVICTKPPTVRFTQVRNEWVRDARLSLKAVGLLVYLHSHQEGYELTTAQMIRDHTDGKDAVRNGLGELEDAGYLTRLRGRGDGGRFGEVDYQLADPFDAEGRLTRQSYAEEWRETRQSGLPAAGEPQRVIRPIEEEGEKTKGVPTEPPGAKQLRLVEGMPAGLSAAAAFDTFWAAYPRKVGKDAARRAWGKVTRRTDPAVILAGLAGYPFDLSRSQFIPHPATWLNGGRWEDDPAAVNGPREEARNVSGGGYRPPYRNPDPTDPANLGAFDGAF